MTDECKCIAVTRIVVIYPPLIMNTSIINNEILMFLSQIFCITIFLTIIKSLLHHYEL